MTTTPRLLFVSHSGVIAGSELTLCELVGQLAKTGLARPAVVFPSDGPLVARIRELGIPTWITPYGRWADLPMPIHRKVAMEIRNVLAVQPLARLFRSQRPDAVISNTLTVPSGALAARRARIPHLWHVHEYGAPEHGVNFHFGRRSSLRLVGLLSRCVIVPSRFLERELAGHVRVPIRVVRQGAEVPDLPPPASTEGGSSPCRLLVLGYKVPGKGQEDAIRAVALLNRSGVDATLSLVGANSPGYVGHLERLVSALGVGDLVEFVEFSDDPFNVLARSDVLLMCSRKEGFARPIVEAMKLGRPVVAARSGAVPELVTDGETGLLYEPGDPRDLAGRIRVLIEDPGKKDRLVQQARSWATERFTLERYAADFMRVVREALMASPPDAESAGERRSPGVSEEAV
ncbi:MAG: glycosyltransferase family 4 protein [Actinomycetota bacterium]